MPLGYRAGVFCHFFEWATAQPPGVGATRFQRHQGGKAMLVLTRRTGEEIVIDGQIRVIVVGVRREQVRLGVCAPLPVRVDRQEVHARRSVGPPPERPVDDETAS